MFENEIKFISDFSLNKIKNLGSFVTFEKLSASELHPALVSYISAELDYMIYRDRKKLLRDSIFDYTGREISDHLNVIAAEIKKSKKISIDDIEKLILQAVSFNVNYVVRPKWSITKLIYNDQDFISVDELQRMLNYLYYYDYVKSVLSAYISRRNVIQLTATEFDLILNKIDRELFKSNTEELINNALHSISDIFNIGGIEKTRVSLAAVEIFLREKNLMDYLLKLRHSIPNRTKNKYEISDITKIFSSTRTIYPESIIGSPEKESFIDQKEKSEPEVFEEKIETIEFHDSEIVTEEKIKSKIGKDEPVIDEILVEETPEKIITESELVKEELLPIEEEFRGELLDDETTGGIVEPSNIIEKIEISNSLETEVQNEITFEEDLVNVLDEKTKDEISVEDTVVQEPDVEVTETEEEIIIEDELAEDEEAKPEEDDLLAFYEQELVTMGEKENAPEYNGDQAEIIEDNIAGQNKEISEDVSVDDESIVDETDQVTDEIVKEEKESNDDIDFSIFDDEEAEKDFNEILSKVSADFHGELLQTDDKESSGTQEEITSSGDSESELDIDSAKDLVDEIDSVELTSSGKEIVDEMLDDYFGMEKPKDEEQKEEISEQSDNMVEDKITEEPVKSEEPELPSEPLKQEVESEVGDNVLDSNLSAEIPEGSSVDDISSMIDEIDDIIEKNNLDNSKTEIIEDKSTQEQQDELPLDEEFKLDDEMDLGNGIKADDKSKVDEDDIVTENKAPVEETATLDEQGKKIEDQTMGKELPVREKDLFTYLSSKEVKKIVSNVFASDYEDFVTTIEKISECVTYKQATEILKGVFFTYRVSPYSKDAVILTNAVSHFFRQA